jgi:hypothetical protein
MRGITMATATATFGKKGVYHSELRKAGPLTIAFTGEVRESQYRGKPPYVEFRVHGDDATYQYQVENEEIAALIKDLPRNEWIEVVADGSKDTADLQVTHDVRGSDPYTGATPSAAAPVRQSAPTGDAGGDSLARILWRCLEVSAQLVDQFEAKHKRPMNEHDRAIAISLAIELHRGNKLPLSL